MLAAPLRSSGTGFGDGLRAEWPCVILGHMFGAGLLTSPKPSTAGLLGDVGRPAVGPVLRSGDRSTTTAWERTGVYERQPCLRSSQLLAHECGSSFTDLRAGSGDAVIGSRDDD